jgi:hypothetical protein
MAFATRSRLQAAVVSADQAPRQGGRSPVEDLRLLLEYPIAGCAILAIALSRLKELSHRT